MMPMESSPKRQKSKGKEIIMEEDEEEAEGEELAVESDPTADTTCGICISDDGRSIRGQIDSCSHYFCFVCIMEWAKVETRCPMCKQRFRSIRRPAVDGVFTCDRIVDVPERNQVYDCYGHGSTAPTDPYANIICIECQTAVNEELLLLCDLCDSASHTYCVGLGPTIPEGDWYCRDCTRIRDEHSRTQSDSVGCNQDSYNSLRAIRASEMQFPTSEGSSSLLVTDLSQRFSTEVVDQPQANNSEHNFPLLDSDSSNQDSETPVSIFEIVSDGIVTDSSQGVSSRSVRQGQGNIGDIPQQKTNFTERGSQDRADSTGEILPCTQARREQHVRTLRKCRDVQVRIRKIRENWNAIRSGSLTFSSNFINCSRVFNESAKKNRVDSDATRLTESVSALNSDQTADGSALNKRSHNAGPQDVKKAWKMLKIAKSVKGARKTVVLNHSSNVSSKGNISKDAGDHNLRPFVSNGYNLPHRLEVGTTLKIVNGQRKFPNHEKVKKKPCIEKEMKHFHGRPINSQSTYMQTAPKEDMHRHKNSSNQQVSDADLPVNIGWDRPNFHGSSTSSHPVNPALSSCSEVDSNEKKLSVGSPTFKTSIRRNGRNCSAKEEVQSLVKLNLKLQSTNQRLDGDSFKEVARVATHSILAACGLEHSKSSARVIPFPKCKHTNRELRRSNLMSNSCRECFFSFVKDVVNSIFLEKFPIGKHAG